MRSAAMPFAPLKASKQRTVSGMSYTTVAASASIHTKGAWTTIIAATPFDSDMTILYVSDIGVTNSATPALLDLAIGAAGSEIIICENLNVGYADAWDLANNIPFMLILPLRIPEGVRVAARLQALIASDVAQVAVDLYGGAPTNDPSGFASMDTYGADTSLSKGTSFTPTNGSKGSWVEITPSTARHLDSVIASVGFNGASSTSARNTLMDIGAGPAGSEVVVAPDINIFHSNNEKQSWVSMSNVPLDLNLPAGTRLAVRGATSSSATAYDVCLHGLRR